MKRAGEGRIAEDTRAAWARGYAVGFQIVGIAMELVFPCGVGFYVDRTFSTLPIFTIVGAVLGIAVAGLHFVQFCRGGFLMDSRRKGVGEISSSEAKGGET